MCQGYPNGTGILVAIIIEDNQNILLNVIFIQTVQEDNVENNSVNNSEIVSRHEYYR